jgi:UDP-N-acetylglucosamine acyltransferase
VSKIDKRAIIEDGAIIGDDVEIGPNVYISKDAKIGNRVIIHHSATIEGDTTIGDGCEIYSHAVIGSDPQDVTYQKEDFSKLIIGKNNKIREFFLLNPGTSKEDGVTIIGDKNFFLGYTHIAHDCKIGNNIIMANGVTLA